MNNKSFICLIFCLPLLMLGCSKEHSASHEETQNIQEVAARQSKGATQISGVGFLGTTNECSNPAGQGATFIIRMTGDLEGCLYSFVDEFDCTPSGTYREWGSEYFVGTYKGQPGTFWTDYSFEGKYEGCPEDGEPLGAEIFGRCQHPVIEGTGTGVFEGVTGRLDFKDDIEAGNFPFRGHLKF